MEDVQGYKKCRTLRPVSQVFSWLVAREGGKAKDGGMSEESCFQQREGGVDMSVLCTADSRTGETTNSPSHPLLGKYGLLSNHGRLRETCPTYEARGAWLGFSHKRETEEIFGKSIEGLEVRERKGFLPSKGSVGNRAYEIKQP